MNKKSIIKNIMRPIVNAGFQVYFVGGCVRDEILDEESHDYDLVTSAKPSDLHKLFNNFVGINSERFGITVILCDGESVEVATLREDSPDGDGRHPDKVSFTDSVANDASRRDFTMNAVYEDIDGNIIDPKKGVKDIENKVLSFVGNARQRIEEDKLRLLRMFRFLSVKDVELNYYDFEDVGKYIKDCKRMGRNPIENVSGERIGQELRKLFGGKHVMKALHIMSDMGLMQYIVPQWNDMENCKQNPKWHTEGNVANHTLMVCDAMSKIDGHDWIDMAAALLHDIGKPEAGKRNGPKHEGDDFNSQIGHDSIGENMAIYILLENWKMTIADTEKIVSAVGMHMQMHEINLMHDCDQWTILQSENAQHLINIAIADDIGHISSVPEERFVMADYLKTEKAKWFIANKLPAPLVTGETLIKNGCLPNEKFKKAISVAYSCQLDKSAETRNCSLSEKDKKIILSNAIGLARQ